MSKPTKLIASILCQATSDDRVTPVHARKMAALMEAQGHDVLFYENTDGGHAAAANHKQGLKCGRKVSSISNRNWGWATK